MGNSNLVIQDNEVLIKASDILLSITNKDGIIASANSVFCEVSGYSPSAINGRPQNIIRHADMPKYFFRLMWDTIEAGFPFGGYLKNKTKTGQYFWVFSLIFQIENHYLAISMKANNRQRNELEALYRQMREAETNSLEKSQEHLNLWLLHHGHIDYYAWMATTLEQEMLNHPFFSDILLENDAHLDLIANSSSLLQKITAQATHHLWDSYVIFQKNFKNCLIRLKECIQMMTRFQSHMMSLTTLESAAPPLFKPQSREFSTTSIHRMHLDFFHQATLRLQFWHNSLILQAKLIDDLIFDSINSFSQNDSGQINKVYEALNIIHMITENISALPANLEADYDRVHQKTNAYLTLIDIENKPEVLDSQGNETAKKLVTELKDTSRQMLSIYSGLCNDFEIDIKEFHQVVRSAFHILLGPKRASS